MGLSKKIQDPQTRAKFADDCAQLMDEQVATKKGLGGLAIKTAYGVLKNIGPGYIPRTINNLLPKALPAIDPLWEEGVAAGDPVAHLSNNREKTAEVLLGVTDAKIANAKNRVVIGTYNKLRNSVKGDVEAAIPDLAKIMGQYT